MYKSNRVFSVLVLLVFILTACGGGGGGKKKAPPNNAPVALADAYGTDENTLLDIDAAAGVLSNDSDADQEALQAVLVSGTSHGTLTLNADGSFSYDPDAGFGGSDVFSYLARDGKADSAAVTVTLTVTERNDIPVATNDTYVTDENQALNINATAGVLSNDSDEDLDPLKVVLVDGVANGDLVINPDGSFLYTPNAGFGGSDQFTYRANDGTVDSNLATVNITVIERNDKPVGVADQYTAFAAITLAVTSGGVLDNDKDEDLNPLTAVLVTPPAGGILDLKTDGTFTYTPNEGFSGDDSFTYQADDGMVLSDATTVTITVVPPPLAQDDGYETNEDVTLTVDASSGVLANDSDRFGPPDLQVSVIDSTKNGTLALNADGSFEYAPNKNYHGGDGFTYEVIDQGNQTKSQATVSITVKSINDPPVAGNDSVTAHMNKPLLIQVQSDLLANDSDVDLNPLSLQSFTDPSGGTLTDNLDGTLTYTPVTDFFGQVTFTYVASDGQAVSNSATVTINVITNFAPVIVTGSIGFDKQVVDTTVKQTHAVAGADFNRDGHVDLVATNYVDGKVFLYMNDGSGGFTATELDAALAGAYPVTVADLDLDGDVDVLAGGYLADTLIWYKNDGAGVFTPITIDAAANGIHSVVAGDLDKDGDLDLLTSNQDGNSVQWYENDGSNNFPLPPHSIDKAASAVKMADMADIDKDGDLDVVAAVFNDNAIVWYENDGFQVFANKHVIDATATGAYYVTATDVDGDKYPDLLVASQTAGTIMLYRNNGAVFTAEPLDTSAAGARSVIAADMDGDGDDDAISTSVDNNTIAWYRNDAGSFSARFTVDGAAAGAYGVFAVDADNDGDTDILSASRDDNAVAVHEQIKKHTAPVNLGGTLLIDTTLLQATDVDDDATGLTYTLTAAPQFGELRLNGVAVAANGTFTQDDIDNNRVSYVHGGAFVLPDVFTFKVADGGEFGAGAAGGDMTITITDPDAAAKLLVHLPLDEGSGVVAGDVSGNGHDGTLVNGPLFEANSADGSPFALRFDGIDDRIDLGVLDVNGTGLTLAAWFNGDSFPGPSGDPRLISKASGVSSDEHVFMLSLINSGGETRLRARVRVAGVTTNLVASSGAVVTGQWFHGAVTYDGAFVRLYLNGIEVGTAPLTGTVDTDATIPVVVGNQPGTFDRPFHGLIDNVRILERALSAEEIAGIAALPQ